MGSPIGVRAKQVHDRQKPLKGWYFRTKHGGTSGLPLQFSPCENRRITYVM